MKVNFFSFTLIILFVFPVEAKTPNEYFNENQKRLCNVFFDEHSTDAINHCGELMLKDSVKKLKQRNEEITTELKRWDQKRMMKFFIREQKSWEKYKHARCYYSSLGRNKEIDVYQNNLNICNAIENYRRIETLEQEPYLS